MEHDDRAPVATFHVAPPWAAGSIVPLSEAQAHHARVKRLDAGDAVRVSSGAGYVAIGLLQERGKANFDVMVETLEVVPRPPKIHLRVPIGDRDRMLWLAEKATELGIATWQPVRFRRSASVAPRGEGAAFSDKVRARMVAALEQSGGAWLPELLPEAAPQSLGVQAGELAILLDVDGAPILPLLTLDATRAPVILFGPEGGIDASEGSALRAAGWIAARLAPSILRFETAGLAAVAVARATTIVPER